TMRGTDRSDNPLMTYSTAALSQVMKQIAKLALAGGYRQETLARALGSTPPAIRKHFASRQPREETLIKYATLLKIPREFLGFYERPRRPLALEEKKKWLGRLS